MAIKEQIGYQHFIHFGDATSEFCAYCVRFGHSVNDEKNKIKLLKTEPLMVNMFSTEFY